ncbi:hypothetical protein AB0L44_37405 [Nonomuraea wenchangensis]|uniref:hypothetical protein n=1 Tax=Nonomuraea wenchangensis TaxID=568860 RepID=UPI00342BE64B
MAAAVLTRDGHAGRAYHLTGPEVLTPRQMIRHLAEATGRDLCFEELTPGQARQEWGTPGSRPNLSLFPGLQADPRSRRRRRRGHVPEDDPYAERVRHHVTDTVEQGTGRPPRTFARWAVEHARHFRP